MKIWNDCQRDHRTVPNNRLPCWFWLLVILSMYAKTTWRARVVEILRTARSKILAKLCTFFHLNKWQKQCLPFSSFWKLLKIQQALKTPLILREFNFWVAIFIERVYLLKDSFFHRDTTLPHRVNLENHFNEIFEYANILDQLKRFCTSGFHICLPRLSINIWACPYC